MTRENLTECVSLPYRHPSIRCVPYVRYGSCVVTSHTFKVCHFRFFRTRTFAPDWSSTKGQPIFSPMFITINCHLTHVKSESICCSQKEFKIIRISNFFKNMTLLLTLRKEGLPIFSCTSFKLSFSAFSQICALIPVNLNFGTFVLVIWILREWET